MPVRVKAAWTLMSELTGTDDPWNSPDKAVDKYDQAYCRMVDHIDWMRVFLEASARHMALDHSDLDDYGLVCPECLREALLATDRGGWTDWKAHPTAPRP